jgi:PPP family 3-phenylpropionic acid transporter
VPTAWPIALYYFTFFVGLGVFWPYFSLYLASAGLTPTEISHVQAISPVMGLVVPPLFGVVADARRARGWLLRGSSIATAVAFTGFFVARSSRPALYLTAGVFAFCRAPVGSLVDASALEHVRRRGGSYGRLRLWGSLGFLLAVWWGGATLESAGLDVVLAATGVALVAAAACAFRMPAPPPVARPEALDATVRLVADSHAWLFLGAVFLAQIANGTYDASFALHLSRAGFGTGFVGIAYAVGVGSEIVLLFASGAVLRRIGAPRLFAFSLATAAVRWLLLSRAHSSTEILLLQPLHGITFGFYYTAAVTLMREQGGSDAPTAAQGLFAGVTALGSVVGITLSGPVLERAGAGVFTIGALSAGLATACALAFASRAFLNKRAVG